MLSTCLVTNKCTCPKYSRDGLELFCYCPPHTQHFCFLCILLIKGGVWLNVFVHMFSRLELNPSTRIVIPKPFLKLSPPWLPGIIPIAPAYPPKLPPPPPHIPLSWYYVYCKFETSNLTLYLGVYISQMKWIWAIYFTSLTDVLLKCSWHMIGFEKTTIFGFTPPPKKPTTL